MAWRVIRLSRKTEAFNECFMKKLVMEAHGIIFLVEPLTGRKAANFFINLPPLEDRIWWRLIMDRF